MKITLDHNCIIDLVNKTIAGNQVEAIIKNTKYECFVVNIGASEMQKWGVNSNSYDKFEELLNEANIAKLPRLDPMGIWDVTFWDNCIYSDEIMTNLSDQIEVILFGNTIGGIPNGGLSSKEGRKYLNKLCDVHTLWCHIFYGNDIFLTNDGNFMKKTKLPKLLKLGAKNICRPIDL